MTPADPISEQEDEEGDEASAAFDASLEEDEEFAEAMADVVCEVAVVVDDDAETLGETASDGDGDGDGQPRKRQKKTGALLPLERQLLSAKNMIKTVLEMEADPKNAELSRKLSTISRVLLGQADKQSVPSARAVLQGSEFHSGLWNRGHFSEACWPSAPCLFLPSGNWRRVSGLRRLCGAGKSARLKHSGFFCTRVCHRPLCFKSSVIVAGRLLRVT